MSPATGSPRADTSPPRARPAPRRRSPGLAGRGDVARRALGPRGDVARQGGRGRLVPAVAPASGSRAKRRGRSWITSACGPCGSGRAARVPSGHWSQAALQSGRPGSRTRWPRPAWLDAPLSPARQPQDERGGSVAAGGCAGPGRRRARAAIRRRRAGRVRTTRPSAPASWQAGRMRDGARAVRTRRSGRAGPRRHAHGDRHRGAGEQRLRHVGGAVLAAQEELHPEPHRPAQQGIEHAGTLPAGREVQ